MLNSKTLNSILLEDTSLPPRTGIVMMLVECPEAIKFVKLIEDDELFHDNGTPIEYWHHITIRYGINEFDPKGLQDALKDHDVISTGQPAISEVGYFENVQQGVCDCVYLKINDEDTAKLEELKDVVENVVDCQKSQFDEYKAHITLAYVQKGMGKELAARLNSQFDSLGIDQFILNGTSLFYSDGDRKEATIYLGSRV